MNKQVTYTGMIWLLVAQVAVMLPFLFNLPLWLLPVLLFAAGWRLWVLADKATQPGNITKLVLVGLGVWGLVLSGLRFPSLDSMATLLLLGFAFKSLEVVHKRDALVVVFIGYFLVALEFLYSQSMLAALYGALALMLLTGALVGLQQPVAEFSTGQNVRFNLRLAGMMLLQCLPLMVVIFLFAPRLPPLWNLPLAAGQAKTGVSDRMAPGDIAELSKSDELAFRVTFQGERPPQNALYWRGLVLNYFNGREWRQFSRDYDFEHFKFEAQRDYAFRSERVREDGEPVAYEAVYEKTGQPWLFTLTPTLEVQGDVIRTADYRVMARRELDAPFLLRAVSYPQAQFDLQLEPGLKQLALQLPLQGDERTRRLAKRLWDESGQREQAYIDEVLGRFRDMPYHYTLRPPVLGDTDTVDAFLFDSQRGFCAHYAGSFVYLLRAVGIPARVVVGYQGGEWNAQGRYLAVHQYDAHAWTEVWLQGQGWVRIDPTVMVAPERTEQGLEVAMQAEGSFLEDSLFSTRRIAWMNRLRQKLDSVQYGWRRWVLGYDNASQLAFLRSLLGELTVGKVAMLAGGLFAVIALAWVLLLGLSRRHAKEAPEHRLYRRFCKVLAKHGAEREPGQAPGVFASRAEAGLPALAGDIREFTRVYETLCYAPDTDRVSAIRQLQKILKRL